MMMLLMMKLMITVGGSDDEPDDVLVKVSIAVVHYTLKSWIVRIRNLYYHHCTLWLSGHEQNLILMLLYTIMPTPRFHFTHPHNS